MDSNPHLPAVGNAWSLWASVYSFVKGGAISPFLQAAGDQSYTPELRRQENLLPHGEIPQQCLLSSRTHLTPFPQVELGLGGELGLLSHDHFSQASFEVQPGRVTPRQPGFALDELSVLGQVA